MLNISKNKLNIKEQEIIDEIADYRCRSGKLFGNNFLWKSSFDNPVSWWKGLCSSSSLSQVASRILMMPASSAATERSFSVYRHIHSKKRNRLTNDRAAKQLYVSHYENLLKKIGNGNRSIFISYTIEDFEEVAWQEDVIECDADDSDKDMPDADDTDEDMPLARLESRQEYLIDSPRNIDVQGEVVEISEETIRMAAKNLKSGKASGPEGIYSEMLKNGTQKLFRSLALIFNICLNGHPVPEDWKLAYISSIHKKGNKLDCSNYCGISVTSTMSRLYGRILRDLIEEDYREKEEEEQNGFRAGRSCTDNVFCLKQVIEKRSLLRNYIRTQNGKELTETFITDKGLRQGCCISPTLFKIYVAVALKNWKRKIRGMGIEIDNECLFTLQFADDQIIVANDKDDMQYMLRKLIEEYGEWGLTVNIAKTKYLCIGAQEGNLNLDNGHEIKQCQEYEYLGITFDNTGTDGREIEKRIINAKK
ncbi:uncharacterized protein LOC115886365 [Sitophilus oryzae]|uniref:Uncharacterized protein LOC115886365 n=1 Tax=Sitophilus oryzae TaxID=7048 RepID=A0A6J2YD90_SITOR|nr:uncharacterized protein LOC115886365 [Sitophilus oryzae]